MKKYDTKPIDFTGCHPVIAEALKRGEAIECLVWDTPEKRPTGCRAAWISHYKTNTFFRYGTTNNSEYRYAEPIPIKVKIKRIMPPERAMEDDE